MLRASFHRNDSYDVARDYISCNKLAHARFRFRVNYDALRRITVQMNVQNSNLPT